MAENTRAAVIAIAAIVVGTIAVITAIVVFALSGFNVPVKSGGSTTYRTHLYEQLELPGPRLYSTIPKTG